MLSSWSHTPISENCAPLGKSVYFLLSGLFCCLGFSGAFVFAVWAGGVFFFAVLVGAYFFVAVWAGACLFFAVWAEGVFVFCCLGGGREFTHLPLCLARL